MDRKTILVLGIMATVIVLDIIWAILNYLLPLLIFVWIDLVPLIAGNGVVDWLIIWYLIPVLAIPFYLLMAIITPRWLVLPLNRLLNPGSEVYYFGIDTKKPSPTLTVLRRAGFALLITLGLSLTAAAYIGPIFYLWVVELPYIVNVWNIAAILVPIVFFALGIILPSSWLIDDTKILFHSQPPSGSQELFSAGRVLTYLLAGYAGISVIINYITLIGWMEFIYITTPVFHWPWVPPWFIVLITLLNPLIFIYMPLLVILAYDRYLPSLRKHLKTYMDSRGTQQLSTMAVVDVDISDFLGRNEVQHPTKESISQELETNNSRKDIEDE